jgi:hypothetical protein
MREQLTYTVKENIRCNSHRSKVLIKSLFQSKHDLYAYYYRLLHAVTIC